jgi:hypothetical protein
MAVDLDVYVFGACRHTKRELQNGHPRELNPGLGAGLMSRASPHVEVGVTAGAYMDSEWDRARFLMPMVRWTAYDRVSADVSAGYFWGSCFDGVGCLATVGVRIAGPVWVHGVYVPAFACGHGYGVGICFLRFRL